MVDYLNGLLAQQQVRSLLLMGLLLLTLTGTKAITGQSQTATLLRTTKSNFTDNTIVGTQTFAVTVVNVNGQKQICF